MSEEILPCPFCGQLPALHGYHAPEFWVMCGTIGCRAQTEGFGAKDRAIAAWNKRMPHAYTRQDTDDINPDTSLVAK